MLPLITLEQPHGSLEVNEERLIRRVADLIRIKSSLVLKLKEEVRSN